MSGRNTSSNGRESTTKSKNNGRRRKKRDSDDTVNRRSSDGPTNVTINGVFLKSIRVEDTKTLDPKDWKKVRDYVINERKKLAGVGTNDNDGIQNAPVEDSVRDESTMSPSASTEDNDAANKSKKRRRRRRKPMVARQV